MMNKAREEIAELLKEPDIACMDWEIGKYILANWKASLPDRILQKKFNDYTIAELIEMALRSMPKPEGGSMLGRCRVEDWCSKRDTGR